MVEEARDRQTIRAGMVAALDEVVAPRGSGGWSVPVVLTGSVADVMVVHFRPTLDGLAEAQRRLARARLSDCLEPIYSFLSVTEAGLYHLTAAVARERVAAGGVMGDAEYQRVLAERVATERASAHVERRLYPPLPAEMPYVCFYPMSKRRAAGQNWYTLTLEERSRLMQEHGATGRRYAGRVQQIITGAIGLDAWEWGVTLFAGDPLEFKRLVTDMRFDEVSAQYADFGAFYVGKTATPAVWVEAVAAAAGVPTVER
jgi:chlorite dismutase